MAGMTPGLRLVVDERCDPGELLSMNSPDAGLIVALATPGPRDDATFVHDLLQAFGKDLGSEETARRGPRAVADLVGWLVAAGVPDIVVIHAEWLEPMEVASLGGLMDLLGGVAWLVATAYPTGSVGQAMTDWRASHASLAALRRRAGDLEPQRPPRPLAPTGDQRFPTVPRRPFPLFLSEVRQSLPDGDADRVAELYSRAFREAFELFSKGMVTPARVARAMWEAWGAPGDEDGEMRQVVAYAFQSGALRAGTFLRLDMAHLEPRWHRLEEAHRYEAVQWDSLAKCASTQDAVIAGLSAAGLSPQQMSELGMQDVFPHGQAIFEDGVRPLPEGVWRYVVAHYWCRLSGVTGPQARYVCGERGSDNPMTPIRVGRVISHLERMTGGDWHTPRAFWALSVQRTLGKGIEVIVLR